MHLGTATVDEASPAAVDLLHEVDHTISLGVGRVKVVVVDVETVEGRTLSVQRQNRHVVTYTALGSARRAAAKATLTKPSPPKTREKTLERTLPSSLNISLTTSH